MVATSRSTSIVSISAPGTQACLFPTETVCLACSSQVKSILYPQQRAKTKTSALKEGSSMPYFVARWFDSSRFEFLKRMSREAFRVFPAGRIVDFLASPLFVRMTRASYQNAKTDLIIYTHGDLDELVGEILKIGVTYGHKVVGSYRFRKFKASRKKLWSITKSVVSNSNSN